ncbi:hypothetical protein BH11BAC1_BH11BAC1_13610 [soil metagenome]
MKKAAYLFLLIPTLLHSGGMMLICMLIQLNLQSQIEQILENTSTQFETIKLSKECFLKNKLDENEIIIAGKIFDIKNVTFHKDYVELLAYNDKKEEGLITVIENYFSGSSQSKKDFPLQVLKLLVSVYTLPKQEIRFSTTFSSHISLPPLSESYVNFSDEPFTPPPEMA